MDLTARQVTGCGVPHQRLPALCSPPSFGEQKKKGKGAPAPSLTGQRSFGFSRDCPPENPKPNRNREDDMTKSPTSARPLSAEQEATWRYWSNFLDLWYVCANTACGRARCCRGKPSPCFKENFSRLPQGARDWFLLLMKARELDVPFDKAWADLEGGGFLDELDNWHNLVRGPQDASGASDAVN
jgi:hypothetical protein